MNNPKSKGEQARPRAVILIGIPASGKSTYYATKLAPQGFVHINLDTLKTRHREETLVAECIRGRKEFAVDNTNTLRSERARYISAARAAGYELVGVYFQSRVADCVERNARRSGEARIPRAAVAAMSNRLELPSPNEGFDRLYYAAMGDGGFVLSPWREEPGFHELDGILRAAEGTAGEPLPRGCYIIARLDGRAFRTLTNTHFQKPFDTRFRDIMHATVQHLMQCGFKVELAYTQSDEISLLFDGGMDAYDRVPRKLISLLAAEASAAFTLHFGSTAAFDCRLNIQADAAGVARYFRWRREDAERNAFNAHCYWALRNSGMSEHDATQTLIRTDTAAKRKLLAEHGVDFSSLPEWQRHGMFFHWEEEEHTGTNPLTGGAVAYRRKVIACTPQAPPPWA